MSKPKILVISEFSDLSTGYSAYSRELLNALHKKYEVAEMARYISPDDPRVYNRPWKVYPIVPSKNDKEAQDQFRGDQRNIFGKLIFEATCLDFQPTVVITISDIWMDQFVDESPFRDKFHWIWMITADAPNQHEEWLDIYSRCDTLLTYTDWSKDTIHEETNNNLTVTSEAPPSVSPDLVPLDKKAIKQNFGLDGSYIIGTVMRNQKRKLYPDLFKSFRKFLDESKRTDILLYCHTSYPDFGWDIPKLLNDYGISSKTLFSYKCQKCGYYFPSFFSDVISFCHQCKTPSATMTSVQNGLDTKTFALMYNMFDLYVQYATLEGCGVPPIEAAACAVPVMEIDWSAMTDVVRKLEGVPIKIQGSYLEMETGREWSIPDNDHFVEELHKFFRKPGQLIKTQGKKALEAQKKNYNWEKTTSVWLDAISNIDFSAYEDLWRSPVKQIETDLQMPDKISNRKFVRKLIQQTLPHLSNSYYELKLVRQLNYGIYTPNPLGNFGDDTSIFGRTQRTEFTRKECIDEINKRVKKYNYWEQMRGQHV